MAPVNFDENIKKKLEERSIKPSDDAWNKLASKLDEHGKKSNIRIFWWVGIAATLVGVFLGMNLLLNTNNPIPSTVVESPKEEESIPLQIDINSQIANEESVEEPIENEGDLKESIQTVKKDKLFNNRKTNQQRYASNHSKNKGNEIENSSDSNNTKVVSAKNAMTSQAEAEVEENILIADAEVESLMKKAQQDLALKSQVKEQITVDAGSLLESVESDLETSFRDRVFETIKSGYLTAKSAVAHRNE